MADRAIFLDRDGVLVEEVFYPHTGEREAPLVPEDVRLLPGVASALRSLAEAGYALVVISNQGGYANPAVDALIDKAAVTLDIKARTDLYKQLQKLVAEDLPIINVAEWGFTSVASTKVGNIANNPRWPVSSWGDTFLGA